MNESLLGLNQLDKHAPLYWTKLLEIWTYLPPSRCRKALLEPSKTVANVEFYEGFSIPNWKGVDALPN